MDKPTTANAYAIAKILGYQGDSKQFDEEYRKYYDEYMNTPSDNPPRTTHFMQSPI